MDPLDDEGDLLKPLFGFGDEPLMKCGGVEVGARFELLARRRKGRIAHFGIKTLQPLVFEQMKNPLAPFAAKTVFTLVNHHLIAKFKEKTGKGPDLTAGNAYAAGQVLVAATAPGLRRQAHR